MYYIGMFILGIVAVIGLIILAIFAMLAFYLGRRIWDDLL